MPGQAGDLFAAAQELLDAAALALVDAPAGPIDLQAIWPGDPVFDCCPALHVHVGGALIADSLPLQPPLQPMQRMVTSGEVNLIQMTVTVIRCVPVIEGDQQSLLLPAPANVTASAEETLGDLWAIWNGLKNQHRAGTLFQTPSGRREFAFDPAVPVRTSGGCGGWMIQTRVQLGGYSS